MSQSALSGPSIWSVSDGRAGNAAQVRAVAEALQLPEYADQLSHFESKAHRKAPLILTPQAPWTLLPVKYWAKPMMALPKAQRSEFERPWPNIWIAAGRRSAPYTRLMRKISDGDVFTVQILNPHTPPADYDLLIAPQHDDIEGENIIRTIGSPTYFAPERIEQAALEFAELADQQGKSAIVILGGDSKAHTFTDAAASRLETQLRALAEDDWTFRITTSRRTPAAIEARMRRMAEDINAKIWANDTDGPNPYVAWLNASDVALVTEDSANMLSDAAWFGLPTHIIRLEGRHDKFDRLHQSLVDHGAAKWFGGQVETWSYAPLREAERVAAEIVERMLSRGV